MDTPEELFEIAKGLEREASAIDVEEILAPLRLLEVAANQVKRSFSGSWLGYHSRTYYDELKPPPPGANFSQEWGLDDVSFSGLGSTGDWKEFQFDEVIRYIQHEAGNPDITTARQAQERANRVFDSSKSEIISVLETEIARQPDQFLAKLKEELESTEPKTKMDVVNIWSPKGEFITRDRIAMWQGYQMPPHIDVLAELTSLRQSFVACRAAADIARKGASHLERRRRIKVANLRVGTNVFIGHGRADAWRILKDFIEGRLRLPWDEFNRVPVAGLTNITRLSEMLDAAAIAFLVMTAEDEMADGAVQARLNVIHEAGLFQGRLGFTRAIVLLEDGCTEFSNIQGLGQIRFPKGRIESAFEEIRRVLEREGLIEGPVRSG